MVCDVAVNRLILEEYLVLIPQQTRESVRKLLNPADPQDVPRAIELIRAVADLRSLDKSTFNPSQVKTVEALQLIGTVFHAMIEPFVNPSLSLTAQMEYLSEYSHLVFMLYRRNGTSFMSNQLYGDSQVMVKNAFFYLARQLLMDPDLPVLLMLTGDDRLENLFGKVRMLGAHNCNVDLKTLMDRLASAMDLCRLFTVHPSWDQGHRRLNYSRLEHCDHLKPGAWKGKLIARDCDPKSTWFAGRDRAAIILERYHVSANFTSAFLPENVDMLRPFPDGLYPGISTNPDPSVSSVSPQSLLETHEPTDGDDEGLDDEPEGEIDVNMDDLLDEPPAPPELEARAGDDWIEFEGNNYHKSSLLRIIFCADFLRKSKERLDRVRAYTIDFRKPSTEGSDDALLGVSLFMLGDLFTALVRTGQSVALAVLQATGIDHKGRKVASVSAAELGLESADIKVSGQVLHLIAPSTTPLEPPSGSSALDPTDTRTLAHPQSTTTDSSGLITPQDSNPIPPLTPSGVDITTQPNDTPTLLWNGDFIKFNAIGAKTDKAKKTTTSANEKVSRNALVLTMPSFVTQPISGALVGTKDLSDVDNKILSLRGLTETWQFDTSHLEGLATPLWERVTAKKWKIVETGISFNDLFPYGGEDGMFRLSPVNFVLTIFRTHRSLNSGYRIIQRGKGTSKISVLSLW